MPGLPAWVRSVLALPANVGTSDVHRQRASQKHRCRDSWLRSGLPTVGSSDLRRDFRHRKLQKIILCAREVLECPNFYLINMLEHSIFLRPNNFASLFLVRRILNSKSKLKPLESILSSSVFSTSRIEGYHFILDQLFKTFMGLKLQYISLRSH